MTDNSRAAARATIAGAVIGGIAGYLLFTDAGRELRRRLEPALEDYARELNGFRTTLPKAAGVASEGWKLLNDAMEPGVIDSRFSSQRQSSPF